MSLTWELLVGVLCDTVANLIVDSFTRFGPAVHKRDVEQDVVEVGLGDRRPYRARHLINDPFSCQTLSKSAKYRLIIKRLG
jgi:hypothetical protein